MLEAVIRSESTCATLTDKLILIIDQLQQPSASPVAPKCSEAAAEPPVSTVNLYSLHLSSPERFSGQSVDCRPFISQCGLHFEFNAAAFSSDRAKIAFIISHLTGRARSWATAEWSCRSALCNSLPEFIKIFTQIFQSTSPGREADFIRSSDLRKHERNMHANNKPFPCTHCGKTFNKSLSLKRHERKHLGERPFSCPDCGKAFALASRMAEHQKIHKGVRPYICSVCTKRPDVTCVILRHFVDVVELNEACC
uniref:C2H2-type domain-containing protein n=1 Tax=Mola mola TaxID=94237 RepID=A0A3Q3XA82_MOLML